MLNSCVFREQLLTEITLETAYFLKLWIFGKVGFWKIASTEFWYPISEKSENCFPKFGLLGEPRPLLSGYALEKF